jgi:hypothetical protein
MAEISDTTILGWVDELSALDQQIKDLQDAKRDFIAAIREQHGKPKADGLKTALRLKRMDGDKRLEAEEADEFACRIISLVENGPPRTRAPRATREEAAPSPVTPPHDPETGEVEDLPAADPKLIETIVKGVQTDVGRKALTAALDVMVEREEREAEQEPFTPPAFLAGERKSIRPHCQNPGNCAGYGSNHCYACTKAAASKEAA